MAIKMTVQFKGLDETTKNLNRKITEIEGLTVKGLIAAGLLVKGEAMKKTPVDTSHLVNSAYVVWTGKSQGDQNTESEADGAIVSSAKMSAQQSNKPTAIIGFTAAYAVYVHEAHGKATKNWSKSVGRSGGQIGHKKYYKPGSGPKFLELALMENEDKVLQFIKDSVKTVKRSLK